MPFNLTAPGAGAGVDVGSSIPYACRFNDDDSAYLTFTPAASNRDTWTLSMWVKRGNLGSPAKHLFGAGADASNYTGLFFQTDDTLRYLHRDAAVSTDAVYSSQLFQDPTAWFHIVLAVDTTNATEANRVRLYVNGEELTDLGTANYPVQNVDTDVNSAVAHQIGRDIGGTGYFDGYLADVIFVDGSQETPASFGKTSADTGVWVPATYGGSYGTNGFRLDFADSANLGNDVSGNANDLTASGLAANDQVLDTPTVNYCTINTAEPVRVTAVTVSNGNLRAIGSSGASASIGFCTMAVSTGKWYWEATKVGSTTQFIGVGAFPHPDYGGDLGDYAGELSMRTSDGNKNLEGTLSAYGSAIADTDVVGMALDLDANTLTFYINNSSQGALSLPSGTWWCPGHDSYNSGGWDFNFGQLGFTYTPPTDHLALNSTNLPDVDILRPEKYFVPILYTGNGTAIGSGGNPVTGVGFQPDLVWTKDRDAATSHHWYDSVRGATKYISSDAAGTEVTDTEGLSTFDSDGFTVGNNAGVNTNTNNYIARCWLADNTAGASNSDGTITSTVAANTTSGVSIVTYTGTGSAATVGHGLGAVPELILVKKRAVSNNWAVYHGANTSAPETDYLTLNSTQVTTDDLTFWNDTAPTSSVFTIGTNAAVNTSSATYVAYCFASKPGFSKFGTYRGNGLADGPFNFCGFAPAFVLCKKTTAIENWPHVDIARSPYNNMDNVQWANLTGVEVADHATVDINALANGFKCAGTNASINSSSSNYVFFAFAEHPFKYARAR